MNLVQICTVAGETNPVLVVHSEWPPLFKTAQNVIAQTVVPLGHAVGFKSPVQPFWCLWGRTWGVCADLVYRMACHYEAAAGQRLLGKPLLAWRQCVVGQAVV